ncbi:deacylase [Rhodobacteraceae bacterium PD-2]|nr:deacylase [Rhodobacteraceae bacterium PD-2]
MHTGVHVALDFNRVGFQSDHLVMPVSVDRSPYWQARIPGFRVRGGDGPSVLLMAGNHGDEYEGCMALTRILPLLKSAQEAGRLKGAVTVLPYVNLPAVMAARRCSPLDGGNLNRAFPGDPAGGPTQRIAHCLEQDLFPKHDIVFDLHSGGTSMAHLPTGLIEEYADPAKQAEAERLLSAMAMPYAFIARNGAEAPTSMAGAIRAGAIAISGEFGGGASLTPQSVALTAQAINGVLVAAGLLDAPLLPSTATPHRTVFLTLNEYEQAIYAPHRGWFEPAVEIGDTVRPGDLAGHFADFERPLDPPVALHVARAGVVMSRRLHVDCLPGDCLLQVGKFADR